MTADWKSDRIGSSLRGENPTVLRRLNAGVCARRDPAFRRANLSILGNHDPFLHAHVFARYDWEPAEFISGPIDLYPAERKTDPATLLGPQHDSLRADLIAEIDRMTNG